MAPALQGAVISNTSGEDWREARSPGSNLAAIQPSGADVIDDRSVAGGELV